jgi:hypothetical protein
MPLNATLETMSDALFQESAKTWTESAMESFFADEGTDEETTAIE